MGRIFYPPHSTLPSYNVNLKWEKTTLDILKIPLVQEKKNLEFAFGWRCLPILYRAVGILVLICVLTTRVVSNSSIDSTAVRVVRLNRLSTRYQVSLKVSLIIFIVKNGLFTFRILSGYNENLNSLRWSREDVTLYTA